MSFVSSFLNESWVKHGQICESEMDFPGNARAEITSKFLLVALFLLHVGKPSIYRDFNHKKIQARLENWTEFGSV